MSTLQMFRKTALIEGISYLLLLFIAMPFKYFLNKPAMVQYIGWAHGVLFMAYAFLLLACWIRYKWKFSRVVFFFVASLLPFVPFFVEKQLKKEAAVS